MSVRHGLSAGVLLLLLAACGATAGQAGGEPGSPGAGQTIRPGTTGAASPEPTEPAVGAYVPATPGAVTVVVRAGTFEGGVPIHAVVVNGRDIPVFVEDLHTGCTVAILEMELPSAWSAQPDCGSERLPRVVEVPPGLGFRFSIDPASIAAEGRALEPGAYRLSVGWRSAAGPAGVVEATAHSETFRIT